MDDSALPLERGNQSTRLTSDDFDDEQRDDGQPVEHVVHGGGGEGAPELISVADLSEGHNRVGHRRADVGAHDDRNRQWHSQNCGLRNDFPRSVPGNGFRARGTSSSSLRVRHARPQVADRH